MAASKWLDPWALVNWTNLTLNVIPDHTWPSLTGASNERNSFINRTHNSGYTTLKTFPPLSANKDLGRLDGSSPTNMARIRQSMNDNTADITLIETDDLNSGTTRVLSFRPNALNLSELLIDGLGFASGTLILDTESDDGNQNCLSRRAHDSQFYECLNYPEYYGISLDSDSPWISLIEVYEVPASASGNNRVTPIVIDINYQHTATTFTSCTAKIGYLGDTLTDVYVANDLNETAPFSTKAEVRDYAITIMGNHQTYVTYNEAQTKIPINTPGAFLNSSYTESGGTTFKLLQLGYSSYRITVEDAFRPTSPDKFSYPIWKNGFYDWDGDDFGTGFTDLELFFNEFTKDGSGRITLDVPGVDYTSPTLATADGEDFDNFINVKVYSTLDSSSSGCYLAPNQTDGTGFEYYS